MWQNPAMDDRSGNNEDNLLIEEFLRGDRASFDRLVRKYQDVIVGMCVRLAGNYQDGEDAAQEVFVQVFKKIGEFRGDARFSTWLYRIAVNVSRNHHRSWWQRLIKSAVHLDKHKDNDGSLLVELVDPEASPEQDLEKKSRICKVRGALRNLPLLQRELIVLCDLEEKSYEEIASIFGLPLGTVKSRVARARIALRKTLQGQAHE